MTEITGLFFDHITVETIRNSAFDRQGVIFSIVRFDLADPVTGGNKWFKLFPFLERARREKKSRLLSFGGPYSNHIAALAAIGNQAGFKTIGLIRGEEVSNVTLRRAEKEGMQLQFINRTLFRELRDAKYIHPFLDSFTPGTLIIPEGGNATEGVEGAAAMHAFIPVQASHIILAAATGTTAAGIQKMLAPHQQLHVIPVLNSDALLNLESPNTKVYKGYSFGGYAKSTQVLIDFCTDFGLHYGIPIEPVYTGKAMYACFDLLQKGQFGEGSEVTFLHTGGLQYQNS